MGGRESDWPFVCFPTVQIMQFSSNRESREGRFHKIRAISPAFFSGQLAKIYLNFTLYNVCVRVCVLRREVGVVEITYNVFYM